MIVYADSLWVKDYHSSLNNIKNHEKLYERVVSLLSVVDQIVTNMNRKAR
jgi:hypothetical protein